ncbi:MAG: hypothetical protein ACRDHU_06440 [Actinomycetota bacterium]
MGESTRNFPFISKREEALEFEQQEFMGSPGSMVRYVEVLYQGSWDDHGPDPVGTVTVTESTSGKPDEVDLEAKMEFTDRPGMISLTGTGKLVDGVLRKGWLHITGATGASTHSPTGIRLNVRNPKRWGREDSP